MQFAHFGMFFLFYFLEIEFSTCKNAMQSLRIASGKEVSITDVPYVIRLLSSEGLCTATLIHKSWSLTAAHCIPNTLYPEDLEMYAGFDDLAKEKEAQMRKGKSIVIHKDYWPRKISKYDFALIEAEKPFELNSKVKVLELSNDSWPQDSEMYNRKCLAAGWGVDEIGKQSVTKLRALNVTARHGLKACKCYRSFHNRRLICLDDRGRGICKGDSGGALVCNNKGVGVAHVIYSKQSCNPFYFGSIKYSCKETTGAYMYICPQLDWIHEHIPSVPPTPATCRAHRVFLNTFILLLLLNKIS